MSIFGGEEKKAIKKAKEQQRVAAIAATLGRTSSGLLGVSGRDTALGDRMTEAAGNIAAGAAEEEAAAREKMEKNAGLLGKIGQVVGNVALPGLGGAALGAALGTAGYKVSGGEGGMVNQLVGRGIQGALPVVAKSVFAPTAAVAGAQSGVPGDLSSGIPGAAPGPESMFAASQAPTGLPGAAGGVAEAAMPAWKQRLYQAVGGMGGGGGLGGLAANFAGGLVGGQYGGPQYGGGGYAFQPVINAQKDKSGRWQYFGQ